MPFIQTGCLRRLVSNFILLLVKLTMLSLGVFSGVELKKISMGTVFEILQLEYSSCVRDSVLKVVR